MSTPDDQPTTKKPYRTTKTEQQRAQADALFLSLGDGAIVTDKKGNIERVNKIALKILGYKKDELVGEWLPGLLVEMDEDGHITAPLERQLTKALLTGKPVSGKVFYQTERQKQPLPVASTVSPVVLNDKPVGTITVFRDISVEHEIDKMKSEFISIASHQLRTPLTAIKTYAHLLADGYTGALNQDQQDFLSEIITSADTMNELISILLNVSRIELGKFKIEPKQVSLSTLLGRLVKEHKPYAAEKSIEFKFDAPKKAIVTATDPFLVREVYANLISNAIKYTPPNGEVTVCLSEAEDHILFYVKDNGMGIPSGERDKIFTKFYRAPNAVQQETDGTGLGLYLIKLITDTLGAKVWFKSHEEKGSTFYFSLPKTVGKLSK